MEKVKAIKQRIDELGLDIRIEVDGGINDVTGIEASTCGADVLVSGSYLFKAENMADAAGKLRKA